MEFPDLGEQCSVNFCRSLDFLPVRCSGCRKVFCKDHYKFESHSCPTGDPNNRQVPVCPLCGVPVPTGPNESADVKVGQHIDEACQSQPSRALKGKIFNKTCSVPGCKKRELVSCRCDQCQLNYCLSHRNEMDHNCKGRPMSKGAWQMTSSGTAAVRRAVAMQSSKTAKKDNNSEVQKAQQEMADRDLAMAIALSLEAEEDRQRQTSSEGGCTVS